MTIPLLFSTLHVLLILDNKTVSLNPLMDFWVEWAERATRMLVIT
jgi:hypothetical protein